MLFAYCGFLNSGQNRLDPLYGMKALFGVRTNMGDDFGIAEFI
jgi:hypothetical protein